MSRPLLPLLNHLYNAVREAGAKPLAVGERRVSVPQPDGTFVDLQEPVSWFSGVRPFSIVEVVYRSDPVFPATITQAEMCRNDEVCVFTGESVGRIPADDYDTRFYGALARAVMTEVSPEQATNVLGDMIVRVGAFAAHQVRNG